MKANIKQWFYLVLIPRFQSKVFNYLKRKKLTGKYSSFTIAGGGIGYLVQIKETSKNGILDHSGKTIVFQLQLNFIKLPV